MMPHCFWSAAMTAPTKAALLKLGRAIAAPPEIAGRLALSDAIIWPRAADALALNDAMPIAFMLADKDAIIDNFAAAVADNDAAAAALADPLALADAFISADAAASALSAPEGMAMVGICGVNPDSVTEQKHGMASSL